MDYNEDSILTRYIWIQYRHLMTVFERRVGGAIIARLKAGSSTGPYIENLLRRTLGDAEVHAIIAALQHGSYVFRQQVCQRLLMEYGDQIFINRCPACRRIVHTPKARQCFWCGRTCFEQMN